MREVASVAGVSRTTVSLALRGDARIPEATRKTVCKVAERMGYRLDPQVAKLMSYLKGTKQEPTQEVIAFVTAHDAEFDWKQSFHCQRVFEGARLRAESLGYQLAPFWLNENEGMSPSRLSAVLQSRGITGVIIAPPQRPGVLWPMDMSPFACVARGPWEFKRAVHRVTPHHFEDMRLVLAQLRERGLSRIGYMMARDTELRVKQIWKSAWLLDQAESDITAIPIFDQEQSDQVKLAAWLQQYRLEAVIGANDWSEQLLRAAEAWRGKRFEGKTVFACLDRYLEQSPVMGVNQHHEEAGASMVDKVVLQMHQNRLGYPDFAEEILISGSWIES